jgi:DNA mismatch repair protein MutS2
VIRQVEQAADEVDAVLPSMPVPATDLPGDEEDRVLRLGDLVWVASLGAEGQIAELGQDDAEVMVGRLRVRAKLDELAYRSKSESKREKKRAGVRSKATTAAASSSRSVSPGLELDLRGETVEDALPRLDDYLDAAYMAGLPFVRIIHGKGTGVLRTAVRDALHGHPLVKKHARGGEKEGGDGVTVVTIAPMR